MVIISWQSSTQEIKNVIRRKFLLDHRSLLGWTFLTVTGVFYRSPPLPITCYHGNCYVDCLEVIRDAKSTKALKFILVTEGKLYKLKTKILYQNCSLIPGSHQQKKWLFHWENWKTRRRGWDVRVKKWNQLIDKSSECFRY